MDRSIKLELLMTLKQYQPDSYPQYPIAPGVTARQLLGILGIPEYEVNLIFINGKKGDLDSIIEGGERVVLYPPLGGG